MLNTATGVVEHAMQTLKNVIIGNLEDKIVFTGNINRTLRVVRFTIHTGLNVSPFDIHHGRKPRTEIINIVKDVKSCLSHWKTMNVSVPPKKVPFYIAWNGKEEVIDHIVRACKKSSLAVHPRNHWSESWYSRLLETSSTFTHC